MCCSIYFFLNSANLRCRSISESPMDFEITRVECSVIMGIPIKDHSCGTHTSRMTQNCINYNENYNSKIRAKEKALVEPW